MKKLFILAPFAMAALLTLVGCAECDEVTSEGGDSKVPVKLTATTQSAVLRRAATNINEGALTSGSVSVRTSSSYTTAYAYTAGAGGVLNSDAPAFYPAGGANIDIVAYSPADASAATSNTFTVSADQRGTAGYVASDLLWGRVENKNSSSGSVDIAFSHKMAKIIVRVTATGGVSYVNSITMKNVKRQCLFTYETGAISNVAYVSGENQDVVAVSSETANTTNFSVGAVCIPEQTIPAGDFITIATDQGDVVYQLGEDKTVAAGNCYTVNITVTTENVAAGINTIESWAGGAGDGLDIAAIAAQTYTGSAITPAITVSDGGNAVASGNYEVYYTNNINAGTATVYAVGKNIYAGKVGVKEFTINRANRTVTFSSANLSVSLNGSKSLTINYTGDGSATVTSSNPSRVTASVSSSTAGSETYTVSGVSAGSATLTITYPQTTNWNAYEGSVSVEVSNVDPKKNPLWYVAQYNCNSSGGFETNSNAGYFFQWSGAMSQFAKQTTSYDGWYNAGKGPNSQWHLPTKAEWQSVLPGSKTDGSYKNIRDFDSGSGTLQSAYITPKWGYNSSTKAGISETSYWKKVDDNTWHAVRFIGTEYVSFWEYKWTSASGSGTWSSSNYGILQISSTLIISDAPTTSNVSTWYSSNASTYKSGFGNDDTAGKVQRIFYARGYVSGAAGSSATAGAGTYGYYWSATEYDSRDAWYLYFGSSGASVDYYNKTGGRSVRLFRDN